MAHRYEPTAMMKSSRFAALFPTLDANIQREVLVRMQELLDAERALADKGNFNHLCNIFAAMAIYEVLQRHRMPAEAALDTVSKAMYESILPTRQRFQRLAAMRGPFFAIMKKVVPGGFKRGSGTGWRYTWHQDGDPNLFRFETNECIYQQIFARHNVVELGPAFCHCDVINYGELPYIDFQRTGTLCRGDEKCDFTFVRHKTQAGNGWERFRSV